jgi:hypothetical protein
MSESAFSRHKPDLPLSAKTGRPLCAQARHSELLLHISKAVICSAPAGMLDPNF